MNLSLFSTEYLQKLSYERSKTWANYLENVQKKENVKEIDFTKEDVNFGSDEEDPNDDLASMEDDESDINLNTEELSIIKISGMSIMLNSKALGQSPSEKTDKNDELLGLLNQTLPVISNYNRQLKESGIDRILSTFDKAKIEDKVGSWLKRQNSLYGGDSSLFCSVAKKGNKKVLQTNSESKRTPVNMRSCRHRGTIRKDVSNDSDDSLQSGETARYIRSSKAGAVKNIAPTTTMIKTYRMVKSTRDAMREKYACEKTEEEYYLKSLCRHRRFGNELEYRPNHYNLLRSQRLRKHDVATSSSSTLKKRRKVLRKRTCSISCSNMDSSSDSDYYNGEIQRFEPKPLGFCCDLVPKRRHNADKPGIKMILPRKNQIYYYSRSSPFSTSSCSTSFNCTYDKRCVVKKCKFYDDRRPCRRESECNCRNDRKLCEKYMHVSDTSTDKWYVENCSPEILTPSSHSNSNCSITSATDDLLAVSKLDDEELKIKSKVKLETSGNATNQSSKENSKKKYKIKAQTKSKEKTEISESGGETSFERELQMAIKVSKEMYETEEKTKCKSAKENLKNEVAPSKSLTKAIKCTEKQLKDNKSLEKATRKRNLSKNNNVKKKTEFETVKKLPKLSKDRGDDEDNFEANFIKPISTTTQKNYTKETEDTFLTKISSQTICNSTALSTTSHAFKRQINTTLDLTAEDESNKDNRKSNKEKGKINELRASKSVQLIRKKATSTIVLEEEAKSKTSRASSTSTNLQREKVVHAEDDNDELGDCDLVTSTTNLELSGTPREEVTLQPQVSVLRSSHQPINKGILIYAPENRATAPAHSFTADGYFTITKEHLAQFIGKKPAEKFLKYYIGRKRFNISSNVYYKPPAAGSLGAEKKFSSSDSDDDLDNMGQYGDLYESINKTKD